MGIRHSAADASCKNAIYPCHLAAWNLAEPPCGPRGSCHGHGMERGVLLALPQPPGPTGPQQHGRAVGPPPPLTAGLPRGGCGPTKAGLGRRSISSLVCLRSLHLLGFLAPAFAHHWACSLHVLPTPRPVTASGSQTRGRTANSSNFRLSSDDPTPPPMPWRALRGAQHQCSRTCGR